MPPDGSPYCSLSGNGDPDQVRLRFEGLASSIEMQPRVDALEFDSPEDALTFIEGTNGPKLALRSLLPADRYSEIVDRGRRLVHDQNVASDGRAVLEFGYVIVVARAL